MELLLRLLIIYIFFAFFILGLIFSRVKFNIKKFEYKDFFEGYNEKNIKLKDKKTNIYKINAGLYLFGLIKIFGFNFENGGIRFLGKKISYKKIKFTEPFKEIDFKNLKEDFKLSKFKRWKLKLESLDLKLEMGFENVLITSLSIFLVSTGLSVIIKNMINKYSSRKYKYVIMPHYRNGNKIDLSLNGIISIKTAHIISILFKYKQRREIVYERTSYGRSYENSYE